MAFLAIVPNTTLGNKALPTKDTSNAKRWSILPVPGLGYSPETRAYIGAVCLFSGRLGNDTITRPSNMKVEFNYSQRQQSIGEINWNVFTPAEKCFSAGKMHISKFPDYFWLGSHLNDTGSRILYSANRLLADFNFLFRISTKGKWFLGPAFRYINYAKVAYADGKPLLTHEFQLNNNHSAAGVCVLKDSRDNILNATKGWIVEGISHYMIQPDYHYLRMIADFRKYISINKSTLALRSKSVLSSGPPLDAAIFGGDESVRGFYYGRYRPLVFSTLQAETRFTVYKRWGMTVFGGSSYLIFSTLHSLYGKFKQNAGIGIRFKIDRKENINLRLDYALGTGNNSGFYIAFGESF